MNEPQVETLEVAVRLRGFVRQEADHWLSGCPALDVYSQADDAESAKAALHEAVELWIESCVERNTLNQALTELGWHRVSPGLPVAAGVGLIGFPPADATEEVLGESFPIRVTVPAFQAALLTGGQERAAG
jgi:predicted RNase H-like HicB family nuclease